MSVGGRSGRRLDRSGRGRSSRTVSGSRCSLSTGGNQACNAQMAMAVKDTVSGIMPITRQTTMVRSPSSQTQ
jgi:hypothetical protein